VRWPDRDGTEGQRKNCSLRTDRSHCRIGSKHVQKSLHCTGLISNRRALRHHFCHMTNLPQSSRTG